MSKIVMPSFASNPSTIGSIIGVTFGERKSHYFSTLGGTTR